MGKVPEIRPSSVTGVLDIGAHCVRLDIYGVDRLWHPSLLETLSRPLNLGGDVFRNGFISVKNIDRLLETVAVFQEKLREYGAENFRIVATSAVREAFNRDLAADRFHDAGLSLEILEGTTEATLNFLAAREELERQEPARLRNAVMLILGSGSLFVIGITDGLMRFCEESPVGTLRASDTGSSAVPPLEQLRELLKSQRCIRRLDECVRRDPKAAVTLLIQGNAARKLTAAGGKAPVSAAECAHFSPKEFSALLSNCIGSGKKALRIMENEESAETAAAAVIVGHFFSQLPCSAVLCSGVTTRSAVLRDWILRSRAPAEDPFHADLAAVCSAIGRKYGFDAAHAACVAGASRKLLEKLRRFFSFPENAPRLLEAASYLHDIGRFVDTRKHHRHSWYLISNMQLPGMSASEHRIIAAMARYHGKTLPRETQPEYMSLAPDERLAMVKLTALLRVADALDTRRRSGNELPLKIMLRERTLTIQLPYDDLTSEKVALKLKGNLLEQTFGLDVKLQQGGSR